MSIPSAHTVATEDKLLMCTTCYPRVASSSLACVTFVSFSWEGRLVHMSMNTASRGLSVHSKRPHLSGCVSTGNALSFYDVTVSMVCVAPACDGPSTLF